MQLVYRDIAKVVDHRVNLTLPDYIETENVEIIVIPLTKSTEKKSIIDYDEYFGVSNMGLTLIDNYLENTRNEWDRKIPD